MEFDNQYLTWEEYRLLGGTLKETPFNILELQARKAIDKYTYGRLKDLEHQINEVKVCMFRLIELVQKYNKQATRDEGIESESIDGYTVKYKTNATEETVGISAKNKETQSIIEDCLDECLLEDGTPYLHIGR